MTQKDIRHRALRRTPRQAKESSADDLLRDVPDVDLTSEGVHSLATSTIDELAARDPSKARRLMLPRWQWYAEDHVAEAVEKAAAEGKKG